MRKITAVLLAVLLFTFAAPVTAFAQQEDTNYLPSLTFDGTTAHCDAQIMSVGDKLDITLELWHGNTRIAYWAKTGTSIVAFSETCTVTKGETYTLKAHGTIGGKLFTGTDLSATC